MAELSSLASNRAKTVISYTTIWKHNSVFYCANNIVSATYLISRTNVRFMRARVKVTWHRCPARCAKLLGRCVRDIGAALLCEDMVAWHGGK